MRKIFCDICGKEIKENETCYRLTADTITHLVYRSDEICHDCIEDINNFIANHLRTYTIVKGGDLHGKN